MKKLILLSLLTCGILAGCDEFLGDSNDKSLISFVYSDSSMDNITRGSQTNLASLAQFGVSGAICSSSDTYANVGCGSFFFDIPVDAATGHTDYYWPGSRYKLSFFAYTPIDNPNLVISSDKNDNGKPIYSYSVPTDLSMMADFMTCDIIDHIGTSQTAVPLSFSHRLTDVRFSVYNQSTEAITLKSIAIYGVKYSGTFQGESWNINDDVNSSSVNPFIFSPNIYIDSEETIDATGSDNHFVLLPQTVPSATDIFVIKTVENGLEKTYTHTLTSDLSLLISKVYTFKLTLGDGLLIVDSDSSIEEWEPETNGIDPGSSSIGNLTQAGANASNVIGVDNWTQSDNEFVAGSAEFSWETINGYVTEEVTDTKWRLDGMNINSQVSTIRLTFSGVQQVTIKVKSDAESSYDYITYGQFDMQCRAKDQNQVGSTKSKQNTEIEYTYNFPDTDEHFFEVNFGKDSSVNSGQDCGWVEIVSYE